MGVETDVPRSDMRIAIIGPAFFGYLDRLAAHMRELGHHVRAFDERPSNTVVVKTILRLLPAAMRARASRQHHAAISAQILRDGVTHVLLVSVETIPISLVTELEARGIKVALYAWDSLANKPQLARLAKRMTRVASFDPVDCKKSGMTYLPLFSLAPSGSTHGTADRPVDFLFCGTLHGDRSKWLRQIRQIAAARGYRIKIMAYTPARGLWLVRNGFRPREWGIMAYLQTTPFYPAAVYAEMARAKVVIDLPHVRQTGLTMRCFEAWSQGATLLSLGRVNSDHETELPALVRPSLKARLVTVAKTPSTDIEFAMSQALACPQGSLPAEVAMAISATHFADRILEFLNQPHMIDCHHVR